MNIRFANKKLQKECNDSKLLSRRHGPRRAQLITRRLAELRFATCLDDLRNLPGPRCHELRGNRKETFSVDLDHPSRLIFDTANEPVPRRRDGGIDWNSVTAITIIEITDTHE